MGFPLSNEIFENGLGNSCRFGIWFVGVGVAVVTAATAGTVVESRVAEHNSRLARTLDFIDGFNSNKIFGGVFATSISILK